MSRTLAIAGGGSWGSALSIALAPRFERIRLWVYEPDLARRMQSGRENDVYLPGFAIPDHVLVTHDLEEAATGADIILGVMPSQHARGVYERMLPYVGRSTCFVSATKGIENGTLLRMTEVIAEVVGRKFSPRVAVLSGPTFAREIARGDPAAVVISSTDAELAADIQCAFSGPSLRLYTNADPVGVELGAALKNVIAIGAGVCLGLNLGSNTLAALITRGLAEISRLAIALGGKPRTLAGLAGLGDLVLTCTGELSRNRSFGIELAKGRKTSEIVSSMTMVAEGVSTTRAAVDLARREKVEMPITEQMYAVMELGKDPRTAIRELMERSLKPE
ncbi:MAG TPA: NAD(P)H-dependent glycerol-3-phosphate dehydrogenase [Bryobacteraceae bacterium]|nr:NAD(P)H-dependent glycerol-3-phosphate dehydrogenase [Bryobacteraceae bacterium]